MAYIVTVNQQQYSVASGAHDVHGHPESVKLDDKTLQLDWQKVAALIADPQAHQQGETAGGVYSLLIGGKSYSIAARPLPAANEEGTWYEIFLNGQRFEVKIEDERERLLAGLARSTTTHSITRVQAPMPGLVVNVLVQPGESIHKDQTVAILEAMKMENDLRSPATGNVKEVKVAKGQTVEQGAILVIIETS